MLNIKIWKTKIIGSKKKYIKEQKKNFENPNQCVICNLVKKVFLNFYKIYYENYSVTHLKFLFPLLSFTFFEYGYLPSYVFHKCLSLSLVSTHFAWINSILQLVITYIGIFFTSWQLFWNNQSNYHFPTMTFKKKSKRTINFFGLRSRESNNFCIPWKKLTGIHTKIYTSICHLMRPIVETKTYLIFITRLG